MREQLILGRRQNWRAVACCGDLGKPLKLTLVGDGEFFLKTDKGEFPIYHGFAPAWDDLGFVSVGLPKLADHVVSYFDPQVSAALSSVGFTSFWDARRNWRELKIGTTIKIPNRKTAWNLIQSMSAGDEWTVGIVASQLTWVDEMARPILPEAGFDTGLYIFGASMANSKLAKLENMLWRVALAKRRNDEECALSDPFDYLARRNEILLGARLSHYRYLCAEYPMGSVVD